MDESVPIEIEHIILFRTLCSVSYAVVQGTPLLFCVSRCGNTPPLQAFPFLSIYKTKQKKSQKKKKQDKDGMYAGRANVSTGTYF